MKNKRGISAVVTTILIVLLSLAAVLIVWGFVRSQITGAGKQIEISSACLKLDLEPVICKIINPSAGNVEVTYKRGTGDPGLDVIGTKLIFTLADGTTDVRDAADIPAQLETKSDVPSPVFASGNLPETLAVAGILETSTGDEALCDASPVIVNCN